MFSIRVSKISLVDLTLSCRHPELIRDRKQKPNESSDTFYKSIVALTDKLKTPLRDEMLVEIIRRNYEMRF